MPQDGSRLPVHCRLPPGRETTTGTSPGFAGSLFRAEDLAPRLVDSHWSAGSRIGPYAGAHATRRGESAPGKPPAPRTSLPVHLSLLSGLSRSQTIGWTIV